MEQLGSHTTDFNEIWYLSIFRKSVDKFEVLLKYDTNNGYFTWRPLYIYGNMTRITGTLHEDLCTFMVIFRLIITIMRHVSEKKSCRENHNTHFIFSILPPRISCHLWENIEKYVTARQAIEDNIIRCRKDMICVPNNTGTHS
jgi:hypothetical protein